MVQKKNSLTKEVIIIFVVGLLVFGLYHHFSKPNKKLASASIPPRPVKTAKAITKDVDLYIESFGTLKGDKSVNIISQVTGKIKKIHFDEGDRIKKGQLLISIDDNTYQTNLESAQAALKEDTANLKLKQDALRRHEILYNKKLISEYDFEKYKTDVAAAEAAVDIDKANIKTAQINLDYCHITSPIDGVAGKNKLDPGNVITANSGPTLVNIKTINPLSVDFTITERYLSAIRDAMKNGKLKVIIKPDDIDDEQYEGYLKAIDNSVDTSTGTILLTAKIPNDNRDLWPGQFVNVKLIIGMSKNAVLVPYTAVQLGQKGNYLFLITQNNTAKLVDEIKTGIRDGDNIIIKGDKIKAGDTVVIEGQMGLSPGASVIDITDEPQSQDVSKTKPAEDKK
jgi:multidrug efflux system membrane fusion protein